MNHYYRNIEGWFREENFWLYKKIVDELPQDAHIVEIGCWKGKSTSAMAVEIINSGKNIKFDCIDTFKGSDEHKNENSIVNGTLFEEFKNNIEPVKHVVNVIVGDSVKSASNYADNSLDFVFIDADHSYEAVKNDILAWFPKVKYGGIIGGDDIFIDMFNPSFGVTQAVSEFFDDVKCRNQVWFVEKKKEIRNNITVKFDEHLSMMENYSNEIENTYIISIPDNKESIEQTKKCIRSCEMIGQPYKIWPAYDGTDRVTVKTPEHLKNADHMKWFKLRDHKLSPGEIGCLLSHLSLWCHCLTLNRPIVILEHDALMFRRFTHMHFKNAMETLGHYYEVDLMKLKLQKFADFEFIEAQIEEDKKNPPELTYPTPLTNLCNINYLFPLGMHAYAIDPPMARKLVVSYMHGIINVNDSHVDVATINYVQAGVFAFPNDDRLRLSTIDDMKKQHDRMRGRKTIVENPGVSK